MRKIKIYFRNRFSKKLTQEDIRGYRNLLKLIYNKHAEYPIMDDTSNPIRYFIQIPKIGITVIVDEYKAEVINHEHIWPLVFNKKVHERTIQVVREQRKQQIENIEHNVKDRKQNIVEKLYKKIS